MSSVAAALPRVLVIQHSDDDPPGRVGDWLVAAGCSMSVIRGFAGEELPDDLGDFAGLAVLGGDMGAYDDAAHPWLTPTKVLLRAAVATGLPTLGICLGHQLLSVAHGGVVEPAARGQQGGSRPLTTTPEAAADPLFSVLGPGSPSVHWNHDVVTVPPPGSVILAVNEDGIQALRLGPRAWGVQSHPEVDGDTVAQWAEAESAAGKVPAATAARWLTEIEASDSAVVATWQPVITRFGQLITSRATSSPRRWVRS